MKVLTIAVFTWLAMGGQVSADTPRGQERLEREVRKELVTLPYYSVFDNFAYRVDGGHVTLFGQVIRRTLKSEAERVVQRVEGVEKIENQIEVLPLSSHDDRIRLATFRAIYSHPGLDRYALMAVPSIHIIVRNGNVVLEGAVATEADKNIAGLRVNGVGGVFSVVNNLRVDREMKPIDMERLDDKEAKRNGRAR